MKHFFLFVLALFALPTVAWAQQSPFGERPSRDLPVSESDFYSPPAIFVDTITIPETSQTVGDTVSGSFRILSMEESGISDIRYRTDLITAPTDSVKKNTVQEDIYSTYSSVLSSDTISLVPKGKKDVSFTYTIPSVPGGSYRLRIQLVNSRGKEMGWGDAILNVAKNDIPYAELLPGTMTAEEYGTQEFTHQSGLNITPGGSFTIRAVATILSSTSHSFTPTATISSLRDTNIPGKSKLFDPVVLEPEVSAPITLNLTAPEEPGVYTASIVLNTDQVASPAVSYRFIVRGISADILSLRLGSVGTKTGETVEVEISAVGPADAEHVVPASLSFDVIDDEGTAGTFVVPETLQLNDGISGGVAKVTLTRALGLHPKLRATLSDQEGVVLDTYIVDIPMADSDVFPPVFSSDNPFPSARKLIGIAVIAILALVAIMYRRRTRKVSVVPTLLAIIVVSFGIIYVGHSANAACTLSTTSNGILVSRAITGCEYGGDWRSLGNTPFVELFINRPIHDAPAGTYVRSAIPLQFRINYASCDNRLGGAFVYADYLQNGGKVSTIEAPSGNTWIRSWFSDRMFLRDCPGDVGCGTHIGGQVYLNTGLYEGVFDFDRLSTLVSDTTIRLAALWDWNMSTHAGTYNENTPIGPRIPSSSNYIDRVNRNIINLWLNLPSAQADLSLVKTGPSTITQNSLVTYTLTVQNTSDVNANRFTIQDPSPSGLAFVSQGSSPECQVSGASVVCTIDSLLANASVSKTIVFGPSQGQSGPALPSSFTFENRTAMVDFVNTLGRFPYMRPNGNGAVGFVSDSATRSALCSLKGYSTVTSFEESRFSRPSDNKFASWNGTTFTLRDGSRSYNPYKIHELSCSQPSAPSGSGTLTCNSVISNTAMLVYAEDPATTNNSSTATTTVTCPTSSPETPTPVPVTVNLLINGSDTPPPTNVNTPVTLSWSSTNADTCTATGDWTGTKVPNGSEGTTPTQVRTYTYTITCTNAASGNTGTDSGTIVVNALAGESNRAPVAVAGMLINGQLSTFTTPINVTQGQQVNVQLLATGSDDPDGWTHATKGVANGGKCEWNSNLSPDGSVDTIILNPASPASCDIANLASVVGYPIVFNDPIGTYTYNLLKITDASGASSPVAQVRVNVVASTYQCNDTVDNDGDGLIDTNDPGCHTDANPSNPDSYDPTDDDETNTIAAQCSNGVDDGDPEDSLADAQDPGCHSDGNANNPATYVPTDNDETNATSGGNGSGGGSGGFQETR